MARPLPLVVCVHRIAALAPFALGAFQVARPKGTSSHRALGWSLAALMLAVASSSPVIPRFLHFAWIHLLTLLTLVTLPLALWSAHRDDVIAHEKGMEGLYLGGTVIAGVFTLAPGRLLGNAAPHGVRGYLPRV